MKKWDGDVWTPLGAGLVLFIGWVALPEAFGWLLERACRGLPDWAPVLLSISFCALVSCPALLESYRLARYGDGYAEKIRERKREKQREREIKGKGEPVDRLPTITYRSAAPFPSSDLASERPRRWARVLSHLGRRMHVAARGLQRVLAIFVIARDYF
jgi:hypothetical protein